MDATNSSRQCLPKTSGLLDVDKLRRWKGCRHTWVEDALTNVSLTASFTRARTRHGHLIGYTVRKQLELIISFGRVATVACFD